MQFRLSTLLLLAVVLWSSLAVFGIAGSLSFAVLVVLTIGIALRWSYWIQLPLCVLLWIVLLSPVIVTVDHSGLRGTWQCCVALTIWFTSIGLLLLRSVESKLRADLEKRAAKGSADRETGKSK
jgi:hypothetical protein